MRLYQGSPDDKVLNRGRVKPERIQDDESRFCSKNSLVRESGLNNSEMSNFSLPPNVTDLGWHQPLWYKYEQCAVGPYAFIFYFIVKVFNLALGFPTNMLVMWRIARCKSEASTSDVFIFNLAIVDAFFCLMTPVDLMNRLYLDNWGVWKLQNLSYGMKDTTPLFFTCICLDRYMAVVHPILFTNIRDNRIRIGITTLVWVMILAYAITESILGIPSVTNVFSSLILTSFFIMVFCNISIIWVLRKSIAGKETMNPVKKKAFKMVVILLAIIVFNYLPPVVIMPFGSTFTFFQRHCQISVSIYSIMDLSSTIDPILYISKTDRNNFCSCLKGNANNPEKNHNV
ncbi:hydroxycarboxylic acid receptor 2-like [Tachysurus fulvidraco]|uniref:hydroxycarboxylic acid receptor 2-like n=1 Tax=Tachysurus fulvidraco TaxID=1234273 RepID=UPI001FEF015D|nr:hydroxycarboxylic acid receptor 2-like [Tachysurus fulvidraco]